MTVKIDGRYITLMDRDVKVAKEVIRKFIKISNDRAEEQGNYTFRFTLPLVMYLMSTEIVNSYGADTLAEILNAASNTDERKKYRLKTTNKQKEEMQ